MIRKMTTLAVLAVLAALPAAAGDLEDVLEKHYESIGGLEAWDGWETVRMAGTMSMMGGQMEAPYTITFANGIPSKARLEFTVQGMTGIQASDGETAWAVMPFMGSTDPEPMSDEQAELFMDQMDFSGHLIHPDKKGCELEYLGTEEVEGTEAHKIKVTTKRGDVRHYYLDTDYYLPFKVEATMTVMGNEVKGESSIGDYKEIDGMVIAHSISSSQAGGQGSQTITIESVEFGVEVPDDFFTMPEKEAVEEEEAAE